MALEGIRAWVESTKTHFWGGDSASKEKISSKFRNFVTFYVLADRTPMGGEKLRDYGFSVHFGQRNSRRKTEKHNFPGARGTFGGPNGGSGSPFRMAARHLRDKPK